MRYALVLLAVMTIAKPLFSQSQVFLPLKKDGKFGFVNGSGQWVVNPVYDRVSHCKNGVAEGLRNDSLFLINFTKGITFLNGYRDMAVLDNGQYLLQDYSGKWAVTDSTLKAKTEFIYDRIQFSCGYFLVKIKNKIGVLDQDGRIKVPVELSYGQFLNANMFVGKLDNVKLFYSVSDNFRVIFTGDNVFIMPGDSVNLFSRRKHLTTTYNLEGDSIYGCVNCEAVDFVYNMIEFKKKDMFTVVDAIDGSEIYVTGDSGRLTSERRYPGFYWDVIGQKLIAGKHSGILFPDRLKCNYYVYFDSAYILLSDSSKLGLYRYKGDYVIPPEYNYISELSDKLIYGAVGDRVHIFRRSDFMLVKNAPLPRFISATDDNILLSYNSKSAIYYRLDSISQVKDSLRFRELSMIRVGNSNVGFINTGFNGVGLNTLATNWYFRNNSYGLLNPMNNKDTLVKHIFNSVQRYNDTLDFVTMYSKMIPIKRFEKRGELRSYCKVGLINNRTGKFVLKPVFPFIDFSMLAIPNCNVIRVVLPNCKYALLDLKSMTFVKESVCDYITRPFEGYMRMLYQPKFVQLPKKFSYNLDPKYKRLCSAEDFSFLLTLNDQYSNAGIYCYSAGTNIADLNGNVLFTPKESEGYTFMDQGKYGSFITYLKDDKAGVVNFDKGLVVPCQYNQIFRLKFNDSFFVLNVFNTRYGYVDDKGQELTVPMFTKSRRFSQGFAWSSVHDSVYIVDSTGNYAYQYKGKLDTKDYAQGMGAVKDMGYWILVDGDGQSVGEDKFRDVKPYIMGIAAARGKRGWGIINGQGEFIVQPTYKKYECQNDYAIVLKSGNTCYFFDLDGNLSGEVNMNGPLKPLGNKFFVESYDNVKRVYNQRGEAFKKGKKFRSELLVYNDSVLMVKESRIKVYNEEGELVDKVEHQLGMRSIRKGLMDLSENDRKSAFITIRLSSSMSLLYPHIFKPGLESFSIAKPALPAPKLINLNIPDCYRLNAYMYRSDRDFFLADSLGNLLNETGFYSIEYFGQNYFKVGVRDENGFLHYGVIDHLGLWILAPKYDYIDKFQSGIAIYGMRRDYYLTDLQGRSVTTRPLMGWVYQSGHLLLISEDGAAWWKLNNRFITDFTK